MCGDLARRPAYTFPMNRARGQSHEQSHEQSHGQSQWYEIEVQGHLAERWQQWLVGFEVIEQADGHTILRGPVADQAALHGVLAKIRNVGLTLIALNRVTATQQ